MSEDNKNGFVEMYAAAISEQARKETVVEQGGFKDEVIEAAKKAAQEAHEKGLKHDEENSAGKHIKAAVVAAMKGDTGPKAFARINDATEIGVNHFKKLAR
jgi:hypothetical protein